MRWHRGSVVVIGAVTWACAGYTATRVGALHPTVLSAWLMSGALLWGPTPVSLPAAMYDERRPRIAAWFAMALLLATWMVWVKAGHAWL